MDAFFAKNRLSAYLDGSLPEGEAIEVEQALAADPALRAEYEGMRRALKLLREVGPVSAPPDLHSRIMARVAEAGAVVARLAEGELDVDLDRGADAGHAQRLQPVP